MPWDDDLTARLKRVLAAAEQILPAAVAPIDWRQTHAAAWRRHSVAGYLEPMPLLEQLQLEDLLGIDQQKAVIEDNTRQFLAGYPANNILLWGSRGTGKSSLIRALLNSYAPQGLRVVQVDKDDLPFLPDIFARIQDAPYRFILFCDDLSFEEGEKSYKALKSALDGAIYGAPANTLIYVTSNRRHLIPEYHKDNLGSYWKGGEMHHGETVEEKISLSDRFGLWVAFNTFSQDLYLDVVQRCLQRLCRHSGCAQPTWDKDLEQAAIQWSHDKSKRCGRTALQFAKHWLGKNLLRQETFQ